MKKIILLALVCTGFAVTTPFTAHAIDSEKIGQNLDSHSVRVGVGDSLPLGTAFASAKASASAERPRQREPNMSLA